MTEKKKIELFDCQVRLGGSILHSVPRAKISRQEMQLLKGLHGADAVVDVKPNGEVEITERDLMFQIARKYISSSEALTRAETEEKRPTARRLIERVFSASLDGFEDWIEEQQQLEQMERDDRQEASRKEMAVLAQAQAVEDAKALLQRRGVNAKVSAPA